MSSRTPVLLCIDDDPQSLQIRKILLETFGYRVLTAPGAREGLRRFRTSQVDAVICDYQMPEKNGGEVGAEIKAQDPNIPVLILSAMPWLPDDAPSCIDGFVCKGEPISILISKLENVLDKSRERERAPRPWYQRGVAWTGAVLGALSENVRDAVKKPAPVPAAKLAPPRIRTKAAV